MSNVDERTIIVETKKSHVGVMRNLQTAIENLKVEAAGRVLVGAACDLLSLMQAGRRVDMCSCLPLVGPPGCGELLSLMQCFRPSGFARHRRLPWHRAPRSIASTAHHHLHLQLCQPLRSAQAVLGFILSSEPNQASMVS